MQAVANVSGRGLMQGDVIALRDLWGDLATDIGISSTYTTTVERYLSSVAHERAMEPPGGFIKVAHGGASPKIGRSCRCKSYDCDCGVHLYDLERYACFGGSNSRPRNVAITTAYRSLRRMVDEGQGPLVSILYRYYSAECPKIHYAEFPALGAYAPIAHDAPSVIRRSSVLTRERRLRDRRAEAVSEVAALRLMLHRKGNDARTDTVAANAKTIVSECEQLLDMASGAYVCAKYSVLREK